MRCYARIARIESDVAHMKRDIADIRDHRMRAELNVYIDELTSAIGVRLDAMGARIIKWYVATSIASTGLVVSIVKFVG